MAEESTAPPVPEPIPTPPEAIEWMRPHAIPLISVEPGAGFDDLRPLADRMAGARVVSLGEATHGTREFFKLKHRLFEWLVAEHGFTTYGFEATFPESLDVDRYIRGGTGNAGHALASMRFWTWDTEEVLDLIEWMRLANQGRDGDEPLHFYGYDMQMPGSGMLGVIDYLREVDSALAEATLRDLGAVRTDGGLAVFDKRSPEEKEAVVRSADALLAAFDTHREAWTAQTGERAWCLARLHAAVVTQGLVQYVDPSKAFDVRDRSMAENIAALLEVEGTGRLVSWAHNGHAQKVSRAGDTPSMGQHLDDVFGAEHVVVGFAFGEGSFQATAMPGGLQDHTVGPPIEHSFDAALAAVGPAVFALDLGTAPTEGPVHEWLASGPVTRSIGSAYSEEYAEHFWYSRDPRQMFDVIVFVAETTAARANPSGRRRPRPGPSAEGAGAPRNLDFSAVAEDGAPEGWRVDTGLPGSPHDVAVAEDEAGGRAVRIARRGSPWRWGSGGIVQQFSAADFRSTKVSVRARAKVEAGIDGDAWLSLLGQADATEARRGGSTPLLFVAQGGEQLGADWTELVLEGFVPEEAETLTLSFVFSGDGESLLGPVSIERVG